MIAVAKLIKSEKVIKIFLFLFSFISGIFIYFVFFMDMLPMFFANMENIEKNILAALIVIFTIYIVLKIIFSLDNKADKYLILGLYVLVLMLGLLRPDQQNFGNTGSVSWNPFSFIFDIRNDSLSTLILVINLIVFLPMYFLLSYANVLKTFVMKLVVFELVVFLVEYLQYQLKVGIFDLSDILLYNISFFIGYIISLPFLNIIEKKLYKKKEEGMNQ